MQRLLYQIYVAKARAHVQLCLPCHLYGYKSVVDYYDQNIELPVINHNQSGCTHYHSPLDIFNIDMVDHVHDYGNEEFKERIYAHVYHTGNSKKCQ